MNTAVSETVEIISFASGELAVDVSSENNMLRAGTNVDIYTYSQGRDLFVKVSSLSATRAPVYLPFYETNVAWLLGQE
jgi:hypothetical protein